MQTVKSVLTAALVISLIVSGSAFGGEKLSSSVREALDRLADAETPDSGAGNATRREKKLFNMPFGYVRQLFG